MAANKEYLQKTGSPNILNDDGGDDLMWKRAEEENIKQSLRLSHTERFKIMMELMRMDNMLSRAKVTHKKIP
jgi:hypothetical protein